MSRSKFQARSQKRSDQTKERRRDIKKPVQLVVKIPLDLLPQDTQLRLRREQTQNSDSSISYQRESQDLKKEE